MKFQATRELVVKTCIELADGGYLAATGGNVALRVDQDHFAVTPSAIDYYAGVGRIRIARWNSLGAS